MAQMDAPSFSEFWTAQRENDPPAAVLAFKEYNAGSLAYNTDLPDNRIETVLDMDDLLTRSARLANGGGPVWIILWR